MSGAVRSRPLAPLAPLRPGGLESVAPTGLGVHGLPPPSGLSPFSPARMAPMLPTVTLHPSPDSAPRTAVRAGGRGRSSKSRRDLGADGGWWGAFTLYCSPHSDKRPRARQGPLLTPGRRVPGALSPSLPGRGQDSPPWESCHPSMALRTPAPPCPCYVMTRAPGQLLSCALSRRGVGDASNAVPSPPRPGRLASWAQPGVGFVQSWGLLPSLAGPL